MPKPTPSYRGCKRKFARKPHRLRIDRVEKEQTLRVEQLEEENRKNLAEATLTELELTEDLSDSQSEFLDTVSQLGASTKADDNV